MCSVIPKNSKCPECGWENYLVWPSYKDCQTCLRLRIENLNRAFARHAAAREALYPVVTADNVGSAVALHKKTSGKFANSSRSSDAK
jgi:hypothetical protein